MAFNELATNALKYGALSNEKGIVDLSWTLSSENGATSLAISWIESGGPPVVKPIRSGVGSKLIQWGVTGAVVDQQFRTEGFTCSLKVPVRA